MEMALGSFGLFFALDLHNRRRQFISFEEMMYRAHLLIYDKLYVFGRNERNKAVTEPLMGDMELRLMGIKAGHIGFNMPKEINSND